MKKTLALILVLLLSGLVPSALASEPIDSLAIYAEQILTPPAGYASIAAMAVSPAGSIVAAAKAEDGAWHLLTWDDPAAQPAVTQLSLNDGEVGGLSIAPDGGVLVTLAQGMMQMQTTGQTGGGAQGGNAPIQTTQSGGGGGIGGFGGRNTTLCWFDETGAETARFTLSSMMMQYAALSGRRVATVAMQGGVTIYDAEGQEITQLNALDVSSLAVTESSLFTIGYDAIDEWAIDGSEKLRTVQTDLGFSMTASATPDGMLYMAGSQGVYRLAPGEAQVSRIMSTVGTLLGDPGNGLTAFAALAENSFAALLTEGSSSMGGRSVSIRIGDADASTQLAVYTRVEGLSASDRQPFVITSLYDSNRLRKAVGDFQRLHPELAVDLRVKVPSNNFFTETPVDDQIRALNTELLAGGGGDVIILDGLPIDKYAEKGILADLGAILPDLGLLPGIAEGSVSRDGGVYAIPAQFSFRMLWGKQDVLDTIRSLADLPYVPLGEGQKPMHARTPEEWIRLLYPASVADFLDDTGRVSFETPAFEDFLTALYDLYSNQDDTSYNQFGGMRRGGMSADELLGMYNGVVALYPSDVSSLMQLDLAYTISGAGEAGAILMPSVSGEGNAYTPGLLVGIGAKTQHKEAAEELVRLFFSDTVQTADQMSALPTVASALDSYFDDAIERSNDTGTNTISMMMMGGGATLSMEAMSETLLRHLRSLCDTVRTPVTIDETLMGFILSETERFFEGSGSAAEAAQAIEQRAWYYQHE